MATYARSILANSLNFLVSQNEELAKVIFENEYYRKIFASLLAQECAPEDLLTKLKQLETEAEKLFNLHGSYKEFIETHGFVLPVVTVHQSESIHRLAKKFKQTQIDIFRLQIWHIKNAYEDSLNRKCTPDEAKTKVERINQKTLEIGMGPPIILNESTPLKTSPKPSTPSKTDREIIKELTEQKELLLKALGDETVRRQALEQILGETQTQLKSHHEALQHIEGAVTTLNQTLTDTQRDRDRLSVENAALKQEVSSQKTIIDILKAQFDASQSQFQQSMADLTQQNSELKAAVEQLQKEISRKRELLKLFAASDQVEISKLTKDLQQLEKTHQQLNQDYELAKQQTLLIQSQLSKQEEELDKQTSALRCSMTQTISTVSDEMAQSFKAHCETVIHDYSTLLEVAKKENEGLRKTILQYESLIKEILDKIPTYELQRRDRQHFYDIKKGSSASLSASSSASIDTTALAKSHRLSLDITEEKAKFQANRSIGQKFMEGAFSFFSWVKGFFTPVNTPPPSTTPDSTPNASWIDVSFIPGTPIAQTPGTISRTGSSGELAKYGMFKSAFKATGAAQTPQLGSTNA